MIMICYLDDLVLIVWCCFYVVVGFDVCFDDARVERLYLFVDLRFGVRFVFVYVFWELKSDFVVCVFNGIGVVDDVMIDFDVEIVVNCIRFVRRRVGGVDNFSVRFYDVFVFLYYGDDWIGVYVRN